jgi:ABC-2 type transport system permease protein
MVTISSSALVAAVRTLFGNPTALLADVAWPLQHSVLSAVGWCLLLLAVTVPLTLRCYRARTTG